MQHGWRQLLNRTQRLIVASILGTIVAGCSSFSGNREVPISEVAKDRMAEQRAGWPSAPNLQLPGDWAIVFVAAFDGTLNDRLHVPRGEDTTVVAKLFGAIDTSDAVTGEIGKHYEKGPGCKGGPACWLDAMTGYSSEGTALKMMAALKEFMRDKPDNVELRVVALGFSRGAATARHFLNLVQQESNHGFLHAGGHTTWSSALLFDTVATGQESKLDLSLPANVEFAVHYVAINESRRLFAPIVDNDSSFRIAAMIQNVYPDRRLWTIPVPGAHSDIGDSYRAGAGALVTANAMTVLIRMGLVPPRAIDLCPDDQDGCRTLDEGLHDSRGWIDRLTLTSSPFSCTFDRSPSLVVRDAMSETEVHGLLERFRARLAASPAISIGTLVRTRFTESYVLNADIGSDRWTVVKPKWSAHTNYDALVKKGAEGRFLELTDPVNPGATIPIPTNVMSELTRRGGKALVEFNLTKPGGPWWFVDGCLPSEG